MWKALFIFWRDDDDDNNDNNEDDDDDDDDALSLWYSLSSVCMRFSQFSQLFFMQYIVLWVLNQPICLVMNVTICVLDVCSHHVAAMPV